MPNLGEYPNVLAKPYPRAIATRQIQQTIVSKGQADIVQRYPTLYSYSLEMAPIGQRLSWMEALGLATVCLIGFADLLTYSQPDAFLGDVLQQQGSNSAQVMLAYGIDGAVVVVTGVMAMVGVTRHLMSG